MAKQNQSDSSIGLDRRQLLAATAVVTAAGIVPNANTAAVANSVQAANAAKIPASDIPALNVCASTARKIEDIAARNKFLERYRVCDLFHPAQFFWNRKQR